jgi:TonB family protein
MSEAWSQWEGHVVNGEFHLQKYLGGSEQSAVFLTEDRGQEPQPAAIKLIAANPGDAELQLLRWGLAQRLLHPHLIRILRKGRCRLDNREMLFAVMEYAEENLAQILLERPLTPKEAREMLEPTLDALAYLHSQGFVHGHLKPANILAIHDQLKLASDSICGMIQTKETTPDLGKPSPYDPPEMAAGGRSLAADVWSLGMTLTEILTQRLPSWNAQSDAQADPAVPDDLPAPFLDIARGCLRRDPKLRLTIAGIAARLYSGSPQKPARADATTASPQKPLPQSPPPASSLGGSAVHRLAFPAVVGGAAIVVAMLAGLGLWHRQPPTQSNVATAKPVPPPDSQTPGAVKPSPKTASRKTKSETGQQPGLAGNRLEAAPALQPKPQPASLRSDAPVSAGNAGAADHGVAAIQQVVPDVPQSASDTIQGTIRVGVRVKVDASGTVTGSEFDYPGSSKYFARLSLEAAQRWKFAPSDTATARNFVLHFEFKNSGARAFATRAGG